jgi:LacI family transcriptional regulator
MPARPEYVKIARTLPESGCQAVHELLSLEDPPTALFVTNTFLAVGALEAIRTRGVRMPEELSFVMFDDPDWARLLTPAITAVRQPTAEIGARAFALLEERMRRVPEPEA